MNAIYEKVKSLIAHNTWRVVRKPPGARKIGSRFVLRNKIGPDGQLERRKARLVAQGFSQRLGVDFHETYAPVARMESFRVIITLAVELGLKIDQLDVTTAYLNSDIDTEIYMSVPPFLKTMLRRWRKKGRNLGSRPRTCWIRSV